MKANEFVKEFGWDEAKSFCEDGLGFGDVYDSSKDKYISVECNIDDLKRLVESWELVQEYGGLKEALEFIRYAPVVPEIYRLKDAIEDVESCQ